MYGPCWEETLIKKEYDLPNKTDYPWLGSHRKFDNLEIVVNLERRVNGTSEDRVVEQHTCDITSRVNDHHSGIVTCKTPIHSGYSAAYNWSGDGYLRADIDNDGDGAKLWFIHGSPLIY